MATARLISVLAGGTETAEMTEIRPALWGSYFPHFRHLIPPREDGNKHLGADSGTAEHDGRSSLARANFTDRQEHSMTDTTAAWVKAHSEEIRGWPAIATDNEAGCFVAACGRRVFAARLCEAHYRKARRSRLAEIKKGTNR